MFLNALAIYFGYEKAMIQSEQHSLYWPKSFPKALYTFAPLMLIRVSIIKIYGLHQYQQIAQNY